jgi:hypothetical protein
MYPCEDSLTLKRAPREPFMCSGLQSAPRPRSLAPNADERQECLRRYMSSSVISKVRTPIIQVATICQPKQAQLGAKWPVLNSQNQCCLLLDRSAFILLFLVPFHTPSASCWLAQLPTLTSCRPLRSRGRRSIIIVTPTATIGSLINHGFLACSCLA